jgi:hypothetical protein
VNKKALPKLLGQGSNVILIQDARMNCLGFGTVKNMKTNGTKGEYKRASTHIEKYSRFVQSRFGKETQLHSRYRRKRKKACTWR